MLSEAVGAKALGGAIYEDPVSNYIAVFSEKLFKKIKKNIPGNAKILDIILIPKEWKRVLKEKEQIKLRRRIEDFLRKYATNDDLHHIAKMYDIKTE